MTGEFHIFDETRRHLTDEECEQMTDDEFWGHILGDDDPCAPGKDWAVAAFTEYGEDTTKGES